jgi:hypothetical protein
VQTRAEVHDTPPKDLWRGLGVCWITHFLPFQCSATSTPVTGLEPRKPAPTAVHARADAQDTAARLPLMAGLRWLAHRMPFHRWMPLKAVAVHALADVQDTASSALSPIAASRTSHLLPFQLSASGPPAPSPPTAMQNAADVHDTAVR